MTNMQNVSTDAQRVLPHWTILGEISRGASRHRKRDGTLLTWPHFE